MMPLNKVRPPLLLGLLMCLYGVLASLAIWRTFATSSMDIFSLGVIPVLLGLIYRASWASLVLKIYIGLETLGLSALGIVALVIYKVTPKEIENLSFMGHKLSISYIAIVSVSLIALQVWIALHPSTKAYLVLSDDSNSSDKLEAKN